MKYPNNAYVSVTGRLCDEGPDIHTIPQVEKSFRSNSPSLQQLPRTEQVDKLLKQDADFSALEKRILSWSK